MLSRIIRVWSEARSDVSWATWATWKQERPGVARWRQEMDSAIRSDGWCLTQLRMCGAISLWCLVSVCAAIWSAEPADVLAALEVPERLLRDD